MDINKFKVYAKAGDVLNCLLTLESLDDVNVYDSEGNTPLVLAAKYGLADVVQVLLDKGAHIDMHSERHHNTPLYMSLDTDHQNVSELLLSAGASWSMPNANGTYPLHRACSRRDHKSVRTLLELGADTESTDNEGWTPLFYACNQGDMELVLLLLRYGANPSHRNRHGGYMTVVTFNADIKSLISNMIY